MPNIRLRLADDLLIAIPAHSVRLLEEVARGSNAGLPDTRAVLLYDLGGDAGLETALLKTSPELVVEMVEQDARFHSRLVEFAVAGGLRVWVLAQHQNGVVGVRPPSDEELAELQQHVDEAEAAVRTLAPDAPEAAPLQARVEHLRLALENRRSFAGLQAKLNVAIPTRQGEKHYAYYVAASAEDVIEALEPTLRKRDVQAQPMREPRRTRRA